MDADRAGGEVHDPGDLLGPLAQLDQVGHLDLRRRQPGQLGGEVAGKGRGQLVDVGAEDVDEHLLLLGQATLLEPGEKGRDQPGGVGENLFGQGRLVLLALLQEHLEGHVGLVEFGGAVAYPLLQPGAGLLQPGLGLLEAGDVGVRADDAQGAALGVAGHRLAAAEDPLPLAPLVAHAVLGLVAVCQPLGVGLAQGQHPLAVRRVEQVLEGLAGADLARILVAQSAVPVFAEIDLTGDQVAVPDAVGTAVQGQAEAVLALHQQGLGLLAAGNLLRQLAILRGQLLQQAALFQAAADAEEQFLHLAGLEGKIVGPQAQGIDGGAHVAVAGEDDDAGLRRQFLGRLEHAKTVQPGHHQVGDHQVELHRAQGGDRLAAVRRGGDREMLRLQLPGEGCADDLFVIDKENGCLGHGSPRQSAGTRAGAPVRGLRSLLSRGS